MTYFFPRTSFLCFDGDDKGATPPATPPAGDPPAGDPPAKNDGGTVKMFTQEEVNEFVAKDKRKHQERYSQLEVSYKELLENQNLTQSERDSLQSRLKDVQAQNRTKEQQAEYERKQAEEKYETELTEARQRAEKWENMFKQETVTRSLQDAAGSADAYNPAQIVNLLQPMASLKEGENGQLVPMVEFEDIDEKTGQPTVTLRTPADAVKRMQELPKIHGNLFKPNVVSGVGAGQANVSGAGDVDYSNMTSEDYRKNREAIKRRLSQ